MHDRTIRALVATMGLALTGACGATPSRAPTESRVGPISADAPAHVSLAGVRYYEITPDVGIVDVRVSGEQLVVHPVRAGEVSITLLHSDGRRERRTFLVEQNVGVETPTPTRGEVRISVGESVALDSRGVARFAIDGAPRTVRVRVERAYSFLVQGLSPGRVTLRLECRDGTTRTRAIEVVRGPTPSAPAEDPGCEPTRP